ncbi:calcium-binding protein [Oscillatoriales cyanobacterium USR001]|nr:calcium-binding protein [Oscillatoriales cyanobacterium USR001]
MALKPDPSNIDRLIGDNTSEDITFLPGELVNFLEGAWALGGNDTIRGSSDTELIFGNDGKDSILGGAGNDSLFGGKGNDDILGEIGDDILTGEKNRDLLNGGIGNDLLRGGAGVDLLVGGEGNDTLIGDKDVDIYKGDAGNDLFVFRADRAGFRTVGVELPDAVIVDFNKSDDLIGLTGGVTANILTFEEVSLSFSDPRILLLDPGVIEDGTSFLTKGGISQRDLDPDGNGSVEATYIRFGFANALLGAVLNVKPADLTDRFVSTNLLL